MTQALVRELLHFDRYIKARVQGTSFKRTAKEEEAVTMLMGQVLNCMEGQDKSP